MRGELDRQFYLLLRETELTAMLLCSGLTSLRKATIRTKGYYSEAFFSISLGLERLIKLVIVAHDKATNGTVTIKNSDLKKIGHDIQKSIMNIESIALTYNMQGTVRSTFNDKITFEIMSILAEFANGARYYNIDALTNSSKFTEPTDIWVNKLTPLILNKYGKLHGRKKDYSELYDIIEKNSITLTFSENGEQINSFKDSILRNDKLQIINLHSMRHIVYAIRCLATLLTKVQHAAHLNGINVPFFNEFFRVFQSDKQYWKDKKSWSIYF